MLKGWIHRLICHFCHALADFFLSNRGILCIKMGIVIKKKKKKKKNVLMNLLNELGKRIKCKACRSF